MNIELLSVSMISDCAEHSAFTDLIFYKDHFYCAFRESNEHEQGKEGVIRVLERSHSLRWRSVALLSLEGVDLRDPTFSITPDKRLMLSCGGAINQQGKLVNFSSYVSFSNEGSQWSALDKIDVFNQWMWRVTWLEGVGYSIAYDVQEQKVSPESRLLTLFKTKNGIDYESMGQLEVNERATESTIRFLEDKTMIALVRRYPTGWIGYSSPPYTSWHWTDIGCRLGGPNFLVLPGGDMIACSRAVHELGEEIHTETVVASMTQTSYEPQLILPSQGDTSYPGMVYHEGQLWISYYSSHEEKSKIYLAHLDVKN